MYWFPNRPKLMTKVIFKAMDDPITGEYWSAEIKKKGDRLVLLFDGKHFRFMNRHKQEMRYKPPAGMLDELHAMNLKGPCQLDGELMHYHTKETKNFIYFYDIYVQDGEQVRELLSSRRKRLADLINMVSPCPLHFAQSDVWDIKSCLHGYGELFNEVIKCPEHEGLVFKNKNGMLEFDPIKSPDVPWMIKVRRPEKNHKIFER